MLTLSFQLQALSSQVQISSSEFLASSPSIHTLSSELQRSTIA